MLSVLSVPGRLTASEIEAQVKNCPRLPSLRSIDSALRELVHADNRYTSQISEVIRRDPSLTARLLRLVNSVYYGLTSPISNIEEAVFYLGIRQIRQLAMVTPVIEDFQKLAGTAPFAWREFWQHCIGVAIVTREILSSVQSTPDEADYVSGLLHDVGKIVMAATFPAHFTEIHRRNAENPTDLPKLETLILGMDHTELGAMYLKMHVLPEVMIEAAQFHHSPEKAQASPVITAAVHLADLVVRHGGIGNSGNTVVVTTEDWLQSSAWDILFPEEEEKAYALSNIKRSVERLPTILNGLV